MTADEKTIKPATEFKIKAITKRALPGSGKYIRRIKHDARKTGPIVH